MDSICLCAQGAVVNRHVFPSWASQQCCEIVTALRHHGKQTRTRSCFVIDTLAAAAKSPVQTKQSQNAADAHTMAVCETVQACRFSKLYLLSTKGVAPHFSSLYVIKKNGKRPFSHLENVYSDVTLVHIFVLVKTCLHPHFKANVKVLFRVKRRVIIGLICVLVTVKNTLCLWSAGRKNIKYGESC